MPPRSRASAAVAHWSLYAGETICDRRCGRGAHVARDKSSQARDPGYRRVRGGGDCCVPRCSSPACAGVRAHSCSRKRAGLGALGLGAAMAPVIDGAGRALALNARMESSDSADTGLDAGDRWHVFILAGLVVVETEMRSNILGRSKMDSSRSARCCGFR